MILGNRISSVAKRVGHVCESGSQARKQKKWELISEQSELNRRNPIIPISGQGWDPYAGRVL